MFITKKAIPRRTFLKGVGATVSLPLLESMLPAQTPLNQTAAAPAHRFVGIWHPHGAAPGYWSPAQEGSDFEFSYITKPLEPFRDRTVLITNLDATASAPTAEEPAGDHARGAALLVGRPSAKKQREPVSGRHNRSNDREQVWSGHHIVIPPARDRGYGQFWRL